jgi:dienelactone hydrolase
MSPFPGIGPFAPQEPANPDETIAALDQALAQANLDALKRAQATQPQEFVSNKTLITLGFVAGGAFLLLALTGRRR